MLEESVDTTSSDVVVDTDESMEARVGESLEESRVDQRTDDIADEDVKVCTEGTEDDSDIGTDRRREIWVGT